MRSHLMKLSSAGVMLAALALPLSHPASGLSPASDRAEQVTTATKPAHRPKHMKMLRLGHGVKVPADGRYRTEAQEEAFVDAVGIAFAKGASDEEIHDDFGLVNSDPESHEVGTSDRAAVRSSATAGARMRDECSTGGVGEEGTEPDGFTVGKPGFYKSEFPRSDNYVIARWAWGDNVPWQGVSTCMQPIGEKDGFGITLDRNVTRTYEYLYICNGATGNCNNAGTLVDNNSRGATFLFQDKASRIASNSAKGSMLVGFEYQKPNKCHQAFAKYLHTWDQSEITGFGVGPYSFDIQWNNSSKHWAKASSAGNNGKC